MSGFLEIEDTNKDYTLVCCGKGPWGQKPTGEDNSTQSRHCMANLLMFCMLRGKTLGDSEMKEVIIRFVPSCGDVDAIKVSLIPDIYSFFLGWGEGGFRIEYQQARLQKVYTKITKYTLIRRNWFLGLGRLSPIFRYVCDIWKQSHTNAQ